jgi:hypothetical protein
VNLRKSPSIGDRYRLETLENHVHRIGVAGDFLLIALANDFAFTPESSFSTSLSLSFAPLIQVEEPTLSIVAIRLRVVSFSGARDSITYQRRLNSSISAISFRISGVIVMFLMSWGRISIYTVFTQFVTSSQTISMPAH